MMKMNDSKPQTTNTGMDNDLLKFQFPTKTQSIIKVVGVGGGGGNAVNHMYNEGIHDVSFALCNTDNQALLKSPIPTKLQLGRDGLGAGNVPMVAETAAMESMEGIKKLLNDGTRMVFITAGMGGGTGTGAAPIVAKVAKDMGILTVGIVTIPFLFEGRKKIYQALKGVEKMSRNVDALLVINNERLIEIYADLTVPNAFAKADNTLAIAAKGISEIITVHGHINLDFADVRTVLKDGGVAIMSTGIGAGEDRVESAIIAALNSPLLNNNNVFESKKILFNIYAGTQKPLIIEEMTAVSNFTKRFGREIEVIWGQATDTELTDEIKITLLASGFGMENIPGIDDHIFEATEEELREEEEERRREEDEQRRINQLMEEHYGTEKAKGLDLGSSFFSPKPTILTEEELNNDRMIEALENTPVYQRDHTFDPKTYSDTSKPNKSLF